jgi:tetratricopeptide (TPR) repeat protein
MALSLFATDANREALGAVTNLPERDRDEGLIELECLSLVNKRADRFSFLPLTKAFAVGELKRHSHFEEQAGRKWIDYLKSLYKETDSEYYWRYRTYVFRDEGESIIEAILWSYQRGTADDVFNLTLAACEYLEITGRWNKILTLGEKALDLAESVQNPIAVARLANRVGWTLGQRGEYRKAESKFLKALTHFQQIDSRGGESITLQLLSRVYRKRDMFDEAQKLCDQAWDIAVDLGVGDLKALIQTEYGKLARDAGDWESAWQHFAAVRDWFEERVEETPRDEPLARGTWGHLAIVAYRLGRPQEAKKLCLKSLKFFETHGTKGYMATLKYRLALAEEALGEYDSALKHAQEATDWFERLGMKPDLAEAHELLERLERN